ncbi:DUF2497 domain-containing protein [Alsobacter sp. KACC 23698]|uniref:DUF2497 domain-containing protein n=1 Tax=Alsobacter sp. KACC 23698 TaxID=3149229 RepID=A0AAU7J930_9HYPH
MEEILASIRRIIADDQKDAPGANQPALGPEAAQEPDDDVLDLATVQQTGWDDVPQSDDEDAVDFREAEDPLLILPKREEIVAPPPAPEPPPPVAPPAPPPPRTDDALLSPMVDAAVASTFNMFSSAILTTQARTLEDLVKDMMRPMLKAWLDDNLPALVERLVKAEIERLSRGPRG